MADQALYDITDPESIEQFAKRLLNKCLSDFLNEKETQKAIDFNIKSKGGLGNLIEELYFQYKPNPCPEPDFKEAGVELKVTPLKRLKSKQLRPKERLVLGIINYMNLVHEEWETSFFLKKNKLLLLMMYLYEEKVFFLDYVFLIITLWSYSEHDLRIIREDWEKIRDKVKAGKAHEISEGDTLYLGACTKGVDSSSERKQPFSPLPAKQRAFSLKPTYLRQIINREKGEGYEELTDFYKTDLRFEDYILQKFQPYIGKTIDDIHKSLEVDFNPNSKAYAVEISKAILGVHRKKNIAEFDKANIVMKTIRLRKNGTPKEDMSFPAFKYTEIIKQEWEDSEFYDKISKKFFFVVFKFGEDDKLYLRKVMFWNMNNKDLAEAERVWRETAKSIKANDYDNLPLKKFSDVSHVRPHGKNKKDVYPTPQGGYDTKKCMWLNAGYIKKVINEDPTS
jgi:DNA mismatch repair protein MutH